MFKKFLIIGALLPLMGSVVSAYDGLTIRPLVAADMPAVMALDREVSFDYFKPLFLEFPDRSLGKNADGLLEEDLKTDKERFEKALDKSSGYYVLVAYIENSLVGFVSFHRDGMQLSLDLTFVTKAYRATNIGTLLANHLFYLPGVTSYRCIVLKNNIEEAALCRSLGFVRKHMPILLLNNLPIDCPDLYYYFEKAADQ